MKSLHDVLFTAISSRMSMLVSEDTSIDHMLGQSNALQIWCHVLSFGRWLHTDTAPPFGRRLATKVVSANDALSASSTDNLQLEKLWSGTLAILLEELHPCPESSRLSHLDVVVATYVCLCRISESTGKSSNLTVQLILNFYDLRMAQI